MDNLELLADEFIEWLFDLTVNDEEELLKKLEFLKKILRHDTYEKLRQQVLLGRLIDDYSLN